MNPWLRFKQLPVLLMMLHMTAKFLGGVFVGLLLAKPLRPYMWWVLIVGFLFAIPSSYYILAGKTQPADKSD